MWVSLEGVGGIRYVFAYWIPKFSLHLFYKFAPKMKALDPFETSKRTTQHHTSEDFSFDTRDLTWFILSSFSAVKS
jgi:hypothetical protein